MKRLILAAMILGISSSAFSADMTGKWFVGPRIGFVKAKSVDGGIGFGGIVGYGVTKDISVNGYFDYFKKSIVAGSDAKFTSYGLDGNYHFADMPGLMAGVKVGFTSVSQTLTVGTTSFSGSSSEFAFGPKVAMNWEVSPGITVGPEVNYLIISNSGLLNIFANIGFWF